MSKIPSYLIGLFCCIFLCASVAGAGEMDLFERANQAFAAKRYEQAISLYGQLVRQGKLSASLLYNLANSYAALERPGMAILNYERALRLAPGDVDIRTNLAQVRKKYGLYLADQSGWQRIIDQLGPDRWLLVLPVSLFLLAALLLLILTLGGTAARLLLFPVLCCLFLAGLSLAAALSGYLNRYDCVLVRSSSHLLLSPFSNAEAIAPIREGRLLRPLKGHRQYLLVEDRLGRRGWLAAKDLQCIDPATGSFDGHGRSSIGSSDLSR